ncbi:MFS transporter [Acidisphaera sp. L21]|uniref:MFS transporter n=1 Tax=Acidisphaera sp. L21 TaxID=1641851 RepID=UPI00131D21D3|nr:MFS transporter [Acidisphaera sp. L21]
MEEIERSTMRRVYWRLIPVLFVAVLLNYLDRINIGFAALRMNHDLGFTSAVFGLGASIFFVGYMVTEVPSNVLLYRLGARVWIARILLTWGAVATAMALVNGAWIFYTLRFVLGVAEAGLLPGLALYATYWFPAGYRARAVAGYMIAAQLASVIAGPLSTAVMTYTNGALTLYGWQWMFITEGLPAVLLGVVVFSTLTDRPQHATWLSEEQRDWLVNRLARESVADTVRAGHGHLMTVLRDGRVWRLAALFGCALVTIDGMHFWQPQIIKSFGKLTDLQIGLLSSVPAILCIATTILISMSSDRTGDRKWHLAGLYGMGAFGLIACAYTGAPVWAYVLLCVASVGVNSGNSLFWSLNSSIMTGAAAAISIALVNTVAQIGGIVGPWLIGLVEGGSGSFTGALTILGVFTTASAVLALSLRTGRVIDSAVTAQAAAE